MMQSQTNKKFFSDLIIPVCEIICCIIFILSFIYLGMNSPSFQQLFKFFYSANSLDSLISFGSEFFFIAAVFSGIVIIFLWINRVQWLNFFHHSRYLPQRRIILILLSLAICVSTIPLFISLDTANPHYSTIGGLVPYADAAKYYFGAEHFLDTGVLDSWNQNRPINAILFAERLLVTNFDFRSALILQAIMFGFAAFFAALAVARTLGKLAGIMMFAGLFAFAAPYIPMALSEVLGITLGALSFTLLWIGVSEKKQSLFFFGLIILTLALFARSGAMFVLPALIFVSGYIFRGDKTYNYKIAAIAAMCIVSGFLINQSLIWFYGDGTGSALSNFSYVIYGLADGGKAWTQAFTDFPQLHLMTESQQSTFLYEKSISLITNNPLTFIKTIGSNFISNSILFIYATIGFIAFLWIDYGQLQHFLNTSFISPTIVILPIVCIIFFIGGIRFFVQQKNKDLIIFLVTVIAAIFISLPFFFSTGGLRSTAATFPFIVAIISIIITGLLPKSYLIKNNIDPGNVHAKIYIYPLIFGIFIIISVIIFPIIGPSCAKVLLNSPSIQPTQQNGIGNQSEFFIRVDPGIPYLHFESDQERKPTFSPDIHTKDFTFFNYSRVGEYDPYFVSPVKQNSSFVLGYDIGMHDVDFIQIPDRFITENRRYLKVVAERYHNNSFEQPYPNNSIVFIVKNESDIQYLE